MGYGQIIQKYLRSTCTYEARQDPKSIFSLDKQWDQTKDEFKV